MKHLIKKKKFGRKRKLRLSLIRSLLNNFIEKEKITTTEAKAKEMRPLLEKMVSKAKKDTVFNRRELARTLGPNQLKKLFTEIAPRCLERKGGYTRIIKLGRRKLGDKSPMAIIELV
jgi:large subunit ribosomal protein L17